MLETLALTFLLAAARQDAPPGDSAVDPLDDSVARLTRLADPVAYLDGQSRAEMMLFHWQKSALLRSGDGVRQGVAGYSEVFFLDDRAEIRLYGASQLFVESAGGGRRVRFVELARAVVELKEVETRILLPGGTEIVGAGSWFRVSQHEMGGRFVIKNAGPAEIRIAGPVVPVGVAALEAGEQVELVILETGGDPALEPPQATLEQWEGRQIRLGPGVQATKRDSELHLEGEGVARVGGARIRLPEGGSTTIWRPRP